MMFDDTYRSIDGMSEGTYRDRGSKFIARAFPVSTEDDIARHLDELRREFHDARHHCYAWMLGASGDATRANDDGEPSGSAGLPILNQIRSSGLTNILVVVVRYFGGTKLGIPGLVRAYKESAREALGCAGVTEHTIREIYSIDFPYQVTSDVMRIISQCDGEILAQEFDVATHLKIAVRMRLADDFSSKLRAIGVKPVYAGRS